MNAVRPRCQYQCGADGSMGRGMDGKLLGITKAPTARIFLKKKAHRENRTRSLQLKNDLTLCPIELGGHCISGKKELDNRCTRLFPQSSRTHTRARNIEEMKEEEKKALAHRGSNVESSDRLIQRPILHTKHVMRPMVNKGMGVFSAKINFMKSLSTSLLCHSSFLVPPLPFSNVQ